MKVDCEGDEQDIANSWVSLLAEAKLETVLVAMEISFDNFNMGLDHFKRFKMLRTLAGSWRLSKEMWGSAPHGNSEHSVD